MRRTVILAVLFVAFVAGALATCLGGRAGVGSYRRLETYAGALEANIRELETLSQALQSRLELLRTDAATVRVLARDLGYRDPGEHRVILETWRPELDIPKVGHVLSRPAEDTRPRRETLYLIPLVLLFVAHGVTAARLRRDG